jgi:hypothetical protein
MAIRYEYNSECCSHYYIETRNNDDAQMVTKCNVCGQGEYQLTTQTEIETIAEPVYQASAEEVDLQEAANQKLLNLGLTQEEIEALINPV